MSFIKKLALASLVLFVFALFTAGGLFYYLTSNLPSVGALKDYRPSLSTRVFASDGTMIAEFFIERRVVVPLSRMPKDMINAFLAAEDAKFFQHQGLDYSSILRAFYKNIRAGKIEQGGSTITQQVAKNLFLTSERKFKRKFREAVMAYRMEKTLSKDEILHLYLNHIYFGNGSYGVQAASETYFGKDVSEITIAESALLAALPKAPNTYSPYRNYSGAKKRQKFVIERMLEEGYIPRRAAELAISEPLKLKPKTTDALKLAPYFTEHIRRYIHNEYGQERLYRGGLRVYTTLNIEYQKIANEAVRFGLESHDRRRGYRGNIDRLETPEEIEAYILEADDTVASKPLKKGKPYNAVITAMNQKSGALNVNIGRHKGFIRARDLKWAKLFNPTGYPDGGVKVSLDDIFKVGDVISVTAKSIPSDPVAVIPMKLYQEPQAQAAFMVMDPSTGFVRSMVGGYDFEKSEYNRAIQAKRQPGSAFKPIIYSAAINKGYTTATIVIDSPLVFEEEIAREEIIGEGGEASTLTEEQDPLELEPLIHTWKPRNFGEKFYGPTTIRKALTHSRNVVTIKVLRDIGVRHAINHSRKLGINATLAPDLSLALGSSSVTLLELMTAYSTFENMGSKPEPVFITKITDNDGYVLEETRPSFTQAIEPSEAFIMTSLLQGVVENGTGWRAKAIKRPSAGKTGTTNNLNDAWYMGYIPGLVAGVWIGYDEEMPLGRHETGSKAAAPIWVRFMRKATKDMPVRNFPMPDGVEFTRIDPDTGLLATIDTEEPVFEVFKVGTKPKMSTPPKNLAKPNDFFIMDADDTPAPDKKTEDLEEDFF